MIYGKIDEVAVPSIDLLTLLFDSHLSRTKDHSALHSEAHDPNYVITKARVRALSTAFAHFLRHEYAVGASGPKKDVVVTISTGQSALSSAFYGVIAADGIYSAASHAGTVSDLARQVKDGPAKVLICSSDLKKTALAAGKVAGLPERNILVLKSWPEVSLESIDGSRKCDLTQSMRWNTITDPAELADRPICILYSSGTTGLPKGVLLSHRNIVSALYVPSFLNRPIYDSLLVPGRGYAKRTLAHIPAAHIAGLLSYFIHPIYDGTIIYWMPKFDLDDFVHYVPELGVTHFFSVPSIWGLLAKQPNIKDQFSRVKLGSSGSAPLSKEIQESAAKKMAPAARIGVAYGLSETTGSVTYTRPGRTDAAGSLGALIPNILMRLLDDDDNDVQPGEPGEALFKGALVTKGYHNNPEATKNAFTDDGWFRSGDVIRMEGDLLYLVDRKKELIKYKGMQVAPAELEALLLSHPAVADAAVIGIPHDDTEVPRAYVVPTAAAKGKITEQEIKDFVKSEAASYKQLRGGVAFVDSVPRNPSGKILRRELREMRKKETPQSKL